MSRDKNKTKEKILQAAITLLTRSGFHDFGINSVAKEAGHDKVLIYRYFGDLNGLLTAVAEQIEFFPDLPAFREHWEPKDADNTSALAAYMAGYVQEIFNRPLTLQILSWGPVEDNPLVTSCKRARDQFERNLLSGLNIRDNDLHSVISSLFSFMLPGFLHRYDNKKPVDAKELNELIAPLCQRLLLNTERRKIKIEDHIRVAFENGEDDPNSLPTELL
jgi:AcrR family transcriptional regulator